MILPDPDNLKMDSHHGDRQGLWNLSFSQQSRQTKSTSCYRYQTPIQLCHVVTKLVVQKVMWNRGERPNLFESIDRPATDTKSAFLPNETGNETKALYFGPRRYLTLHFQNPQSYSDWISRYCVWPIQVRSKQTMDSTLLAKTGAHRLVTMHHVR